MRSNLALALAVTLGFATALPVEPVAEAALKAREEKREEGIYTYYTIPDATKEKSKREEGIYTYYTIPDATKEKSKREEGIYTYYTIPDATKEKSKREEGIYTYYTIPDAAKDKVKARAPQDFAEDVKVKE